MAAVAQAVRKTLSPAFPFTMKVAKGELTAIVQEYDESHFERVHHLFKEAAEAGDGFSKEEVKKESLKKRLAASKTVLMVEEKTQDIMCAVPITDSPACRSTRTMLCTIFTVVNPVFRGKGVVRKGWNLAYPVAIDMGYFGMTVRMSLTARSIIPCLAEGGQITGTIPMSSQLEKIGLVDDVLAYMTHNQHKKSPEYYAEFLKTRDIPLPPLNEDKAVLESLSSWNDLPHKEFKAASGSMRIRPARDTEEVLEAERLLRACADKGNGFGVDEFDANGHFNRKFLRSTDLMIAETSSGEMAGCSLIGPSNLSRMVNPVTAHHYMAVKDDYTNQGVGTALLDYSASTMKAQGHKLLISDTYLTNFKMIDLMRNHQWKFRGSMPYCGFIRGTGPVDSLIVYLPL